MTHWTEIPDRQTPPADDTWDRPTYDAFAAMDRHELLSVLWRMHGRLHDLEWSALNLAQDLSCEFELADYRRLKPQYRHQEALNRQERGSNYVRAAYSIAGFKEEA